MGRETTEQRLNREKGETMKSTPIEKYQAERAAHAWLKSITGKRLPWSSIRKEAEA